MEPAAALRHRLLRVLAVPCARSRVRPVLVGRPHCAGQRRPRAFVDDQPAAAGRETYVAGSSEVVERRLQDGTRRLIKLVRDRQDLTRQLTRLGWQAAMTRLKVLVEKQMGRASP